MTIGETIKMLVTSESYLEARLKVSDDVIEFIKEHMKRDYELFKEKEESFIALSNILKNSQ